MKWMLSCKEITKMCCDEDRKLGVKETMMFWMHLGMCKACHAYKKQVEFMTGAMKKIIIDRSHVEEEKITNLEKDIIERISKSS